MHSLRHPARTSGGDSKRNRLLASLPSDVYERVAGQVEHMRGNLKLISYEPDQPIDHVYFMHSGVASLVTIMEDGSSAEVATVGNEGFVGVPVVLDAERMPGRALIQIPGEMSRLPAAILKEEMDRSSTLRSLLLRYTQALLNQVAQSAACNRLHSIEERCARWLLMTHDRVEADEFPLTQEFLSQMLGVRRPSVTVVASMLQKAGLIRYTRGSIRVTDRDGLEKASCECYRIIRAEFDRLVRSDPAGGR